ncbi:hypothetical protein RI367_007479 [Sorochytrium milnesiophthora]
MSNASPSFDYANPPTFSASNYGLIVLALACYAPIAVLNTILCVLISRRLNQVPQRARVSTMLTLCTVAGDAIYCSMGAFFSLVRVVKHAYPLGWIGCQVEGALVAVGPLWSSSAAFLLGLDRFSSVVQGRPRSTRFWCASLVGLWLIGVTASVLPLLQGRWFSIDINSLYCTYRTWGPTLADQATTILKLVFYNCCIVFKITMYFAMYWKVLQVQREARTAYKDMQGKMSGMMNATGSVLVAATASSLQAVSMTAPSAAAGSDEHAREPQRKSQQLRQQQQQQVQSITSSVKREQSLEHVMLIKACGISLASLMAWIPYMADLFAYVYAFPPGVTHVLDLLAITVCIFRCYVDFVLVAILDPLPRQAFVEFWTAIKRFVSCASLKNLQAQNVQEGRYTMVQDPGNETNVCLKQDPGNTLSDAVLAPDQQNIGGTVPQNLKEETMMTTRLVTMGGDSDGSH